MATATRPGPFARKSHDVLVARRARPTPSTGSSAVVGVLDLTALGIGAVIGTGIFVIIGEGDRRRRPVDHRLLRARGRHVPVLGLLLRRAGLVDPGLGQRVHLRLRDAGRARRVDHRLGPDPRVRRGGGRGRRRLGRLPEVAAGLALRHHHPGVDRRAARRRRHRQPARRLPRARRVGAAHLRRARERAHEHLHGHHEGRHPHLLRRRRRGIDQRRQLLALGVRTGSTARSTRPR